MPTHSHDGREQDRQYQEHHRPSSYRSRDDRPSSIEYRYVRPQAPPISSKEAIHKLSQIVDNTVRLCHNLQSSFARETNQLSYAKEDVLDYIWEDKLEYADRYGTNANTNANPSTKNRASDSDSSQRQLVSIHQGGDGIVATLKQLHLALDIAVDATVYETTRSAGDNRTLAEKLARMAKDIERSRERIFKKRKDMDVFVTDLEMLHVLLKRHGGGDCETRGARGKDGGVRATTQRTVSYERASVVDEQAEREEESLTSGEDSGFHEDEGLGARGGGGSDEGSFRESEGVDIWDAQEATRQRLKGERD